MARKKQSSHRKRNPATAVTAAKNTPVSAASEKADQPKGDSTIRKVLKILGPGLVTGAANDDPSGIATYSSVGAQYGYSMLWTMIFIYPFMAGIQEISARPGRITGRGIAGNLRRFYPRWAFYSVVGLLLLANIINIGADIGAMGAAVNLLIGGPTLLYCVVFAVVSVLLQAFIPCKTYSAVLKRLTLSLFAYVGTVFVTQVSWSEAVCGTFLPALLFNRGCMAALIAILGTTISPYLFFWQSGEEAEQMLATPRERPLREGSRSGLGEADAEDRHRYLSWNGVFKSDRLLHHPDSRSYSARTREDRYR